MKRISLMLALFLTLSFGNGLCANGGAITLGSVDGLYLGQIQVQSGAPDVRFHMNYENYDLVNKAKGITNGYELSATGGATWTNGAKGDEFSWGPANLHFDLVWSVNTFDWNGAGADTVGFGGSVMVGLGLDPGYNGPAVYFTINMAGAPEGETFCVDSCYYPPSGTWMWAYGSSVGSFPPAWDGPHCYTTYLVPDQNVVWDAPAEGYAYTGDHCDLVVIGCTVHDPDPGGSNPTDPPAVWSATVGSMTPTGNWTANYSYAPTLADVGLSPIAVVLGAHDQMHIGQFVTRNISLTFTNEAPVFTDGCDEELPLGMGNTGCITMEYDDVDCDPTTLTIELVDPTPVGSVYLDGDKVCFATASGAWPLGDGGQVFDVTVRVSDGVDYSECDVHFDVLTTEPYEIQIEKTHNTLQGMHTIVDVTVNLGSENMGGFDILIAYDASALFFQAAIPGDLHNICGWEYFNYRYGPFGNCGNQCPSGLLRVVGIAETNNGPNHPSCLTLPKPFVLFSLDFLVSNDRTLECQYVPIRFFWMDCGDNSVAYHPVDNPLASIQGVSRYVIDFDLIGHIENMFTGFPTYTGVQWECLQNDQDKPVPIQFVDFLNGGVDIICGDSIDDRGDVNLNGTPNEIADAVLFSNYFVKGIGVFNVNYQGQVAATDVNADGLTLSVADLVYLIRVIVGDALPYPKIGVEAHAYTYENGVMSVDDRMGAAFVVLEGEVAPRLLADNMEMNYAFDGRNTRVLVYKIDAEGFNGGFLAFDAPIVSVEMATYDGAPVSAKNVPTSYALHQNYPNPFNSATTIAFGLPTAGDYSLTIYNVVGQKVTSFSGTAEAGMVTVDWDASDQASGVYFYKLDTDNFTDTKKMVYLK